VYIAWQTVCGVLAGGLLGLSWGGTLVQSLVRFISGGSATFDERASHWVGLALGAILLGGLSLLVALHVYALVRLFIFLALAVERIEGKIQ
jgi:hypothetical protein